MGKYCTTNVKLEQAYYYTECTYDIYIHIYMYIYIYTVTAEAFLQVWGSLRLALIIIAHYGADDQYPNVHPIVQNAGQIVTCPAIWPSISGFLFSSLPGPPHPLYETP